MITIDKLETQTEKLLEKIRSLTFQFQDSSLESEADTAKEEAIASLESFLELATQDWDERPQAESEPEAE
jgi:hypothetical protein